MPVRYGSESFGAIFMRVTYFAFAVEHFADMQVPHFWKYYFVKCRSKTSTFEHKVMCLQTPKILFQQKKITVRCDFTGKLFLEKIILRFLHMWHVIWICWHNLCSHNCSKVTVDCTHFLQMSSYALIFIKAFNNTVLFSVLL